MACITFLLIMILYYQLIVKIDYRRFTDVLTLCYAISNLCHFTGYVIPKFYNCIQTINFYGVKYFHLTLGDLLPTARFWAYEV